jgi:tetratricopeptide (TPR) repeat protein
MGADERALEWVERALRRDPDDWQALALAARLHLRGRRFPRALEAAAASLSLLYFQPVVHYVMGRALLARGDLTGAERSFLVAIAQLPGLAPAHEALARLYHRRLGRPADADRHRLIASDLRRRARGRGDATPGRPEPELRPRTAASEPFPARDVPQAADPAREVIVVAGLPRSGTSMLMQILRAGGIEPLTDGRRVADLDNPRGYFEFEPATRLARDPSWLPEARGKAVKLALPLLTHLPPTEAYRIIVIEREPREVIASQGQMLDRLERRHQGSSLDDDALAGEFHRQRERVRGWLDAQPGLAVLPLRYDQVLADPTATADRLAVFLGRPFDVAAAASAVVPELRRQVIAAG